MAEKWTRPVPNGRNVCIRACFAEEGMRRAEGQLPYFGCDCVNGTVVKNGSLNENKATKKCEQVCEQTGGWNSKTWRNYSSCLCEGDWPHKFGVDEPESLRFWLEGDSSEPKTNQNMKWYTTKDNKLVWLDSDQKAWCVVPSGKKFRDTNKEFYFKLDECFEENVITVQR